MEKKVKKILTNILENQEDSSIHTPSDTLEYRKNTKPNKTKKDKKGKIYLFLRNILIPLSVPFLSWTLAKRYYKNKIDEAKKNSNEQEQKKHEESLRFLKGLALGAAAGIITNDLAKRIFTRKEISDFIEEKSKELRTLNQKEDQS